MILSFNYFFYIYSAFLHNANTLETEGFYIRRLQTTLEIFSARLEIFTGK